MVVSRSPQSGHQARVENAVSSYPYDYRTGWVVSTQEARNPGFAAFSGFLSFPLTQPNRLGSLRDMTNTPDLRVAPFTFAATELTVAAVSPAGRTFLADTFGAGCVSVTLPKSRGDDFAVFAARKGLVIA